ncbi:hypothetical protein AALA69_05215 [Eggerthellaceae bacterium 24-137]
MNTNHAKAIKGMSIANIVLAALGILGTLVTWMGLGAGGAVVSSSGYDYFYTDEGYTIDVSDLNAILGVLSIFVFWVFACLVLVLVAGIMGVRGANKPEKLKGVMTWNIVGAVASFLGAGFISLVLCIIVAVFANKDKQALAAAPYAAPAYAPVPTVPAQPQQPAAPQTPVVAPLTSDPAPVTPAAAPAAEAVSATEVAAAEPAIVLPDNYIEDAQAGVTIVEETPADGEQK